MANEILIYCGISVISTIFVVFSFEKLKKWILQPRSPKLTKDYPKDVVLLHQVGAAKYAPSLSPFPIKLETYLRMAKIPYRNVHDRQFSSKGKIPWMEYNGVPMADSQFCIEYLNEKCTINLNRNLNPEQKAIARAFLKLVEENLYWSLVYWRYIVGEGQDLSQLSGSKFPQALIRQIVPVIKEQVYMQGLGRHSRDELIHITRHDLAALSLYLGKKPFLMGDTASEIDCAVFGMLAQVLWHMPGSPHTKMITDEFPNLRDYCHRMRDTYWPDWDQCILEPGSISSKKND